MATDVRAIVERFWSLIDAGNFEGAGALLHPECQVDWPLSNERMRRPADWVAVNANYPGRWFTKPTSIVAEGERAVSLTEVTDGETTVIAISWFTIRDGLVTELVEYWPEHYVAPEWRSQWIIPIN